MSDGTPNDYSSRVDFILTKVIGNRYLDTRERALSEIDGWVNVEADPERAQSLVKLAFELLSEAANRVQQQPEQYAALLVCSDRPTVAEALFETWIVDFSEWYCHLLGKLASLYRGAGRGAEAEEVDSLIAKISKLGDALAQMSKNSLKKGR